MEAQLSALNPFPERVFLTFFFYFKVSKLQRRFASEDLHWHEAAVQHALELGVEHGARHPARFHCRQGSDGRCRLRHLAVEGQREQK